MPRPVKAPSATTSEPGAAPTGRSVSDKVMMLVDALARSGAPLRLAELAASSATSKATCHRLLADLCDQGYASALGGGHYRAGPRLRGIAAAIRNNDPVAGLVASALDDLTRRTGQIAGHGCRSTVGALPLALGNQQQLPISLRVGEPVREGSLLGTADGNRLLSGDDDPSPGTWTMTIGIDPAGEEFLFLTGFLVTRPRDAAAADLLQRHAATLRHSAEAARRVG